MNPLNKQNTKSKFVEWRENILIIPCYEFGAWGKEVELYLNFEAMEWLNDSILIKKVLPIDG